jgi:hypothetical protein
MKRRLILAKDVIVGSIPIGSTSFRDNINRLQAVALRGFLSFILGEAGRKHKTPKSIF